jgi:hypothetical protein
MVVRFGHFPRLALLRTLFTRSAILTGGVRRIQLRPSFRSTDFASVNDFGKVALTEVQISPDDGG